MFYMLGENIMIKDNIRELTREEKEVLLYKIKNSNLSRIDLRIINDCVEDKLRYECIYFLLSIENEFLKEEINFDLRYKLKLEEVKDILNKICDINVEDIYEVYKLNREKYLVEKTLSDKLEKSLNDKLEETLNDKLEETLNDKLEETLNDKLEETLNDKYKNNIKSIFKFKRRKEL